MSVVVPVFGIVLYILSKVPPLPPHPHPQPHLFSDQAHHAQPAQPVAVTVPVKLQI